MSPHKAGNGRLSPAPLGSNRERALERPPLACDLDAGGIIVQVRAPTRRPPARIGLDLTLGRPDVPDQRSLTASLAAADAGPDALMGRLWHGRRWLQVRP